MLMAILCLLLFSPVCRAGAVRVLEIGHLCHTVGEDLADVAHDLTHLTISFLISQFST